MKPGFAKFVGIGILTLVGLGTVFVLLAFSAFPGIVLDYCSFSREPCMVSFQAKQAAGKSCFVIPGTNYRWQFCTTQAHEEDERADYRDNVSEMLEADTEALQEPPLRIEERALIQILIYMRFFRGALMENSYSWDEAKTVNALQMCRVLSFGRWTAMAIT